MSMKFLYTIVFVLVFQFANAQVAGTQNINNALFAKFSLRVTVNSPSSITFNLDVVGGAGQITQVGVVYGIAKGLTNSKTLCKPSAGTPTFGTRVATIAYGSNEWVNTINLTVLSTETTNSQGTTTFYVAPYYAKLFAVKNGITYYGPEIEFLPNWPEVSADSKTWVGANLGALNVAASSTDVNSYGWYYNWGKPTDGHQFVTSPASATQFSTDTPTPGIFTGTENKTTWQTTRNDNLWNGVNGINNPCPSGWRLPTKAEWTSFTTTLTASTATASAYDSALKLPAQMGRDRNGTPYAQANNTNNIYWSGDASNPTWSWAHYSGGIQLNPATSTTYGAAVRCIKNE
jgi:uncharacterized protein (TIGR02145 family)